MNRLLNWIVLLFLLATPLFSMEEEEPSEGPICVPVAERENDSIPSLDPALRVRENISDRTIRKNMHRLAREYSSLNLLKDPATGQPIAINDMSDRALAWQYWHLLHLIDNDIHEKQRRYTSEYFFYYETITKLLLARATYPRDYYERGTLRDSSAKVYLNQLIAKLTYFVSYLSNRDNQSECSGRVEDTWAQRYLGQLLMFKAERYVQKNSEEWQSLVRDATRIFGSLIKKSTTATNKLLLAELILSWDSTPESMTREEAIVYAKSLIDEALFINHDMTTNARNRSEAVSALKQAARPKYLNNVRKEENSPDALDRSPVAEPMDSIDEINEASETDTDDEDIMFLPATFRLRLQNNANLPVNSKIKNAVYPRQSTLRFLADKVVAIWNVEGTNHDCFFNSIGKTRREQARLLLANLEDENVRAMIATEILNLSVEHQGRVAGTPPLDGEILGKIQFAEFSHRIEEVATREQERNRRIRDAEEITETYCVDAIDRDRDHAKQELYTRASQKDVAKLFIEKHVAKKGYMMNIEPTLVNTESPTHYTTIDAIAHLNNLGLRIYRASNVDDKQLVIEHEFVPEGAEKIAHIYYEGSHFQPIQLNPRFASQLNAVARNFDGEQEDDAADPASETEGEHADLDDEEEEEGDENLRHFNVTVPTSRFKKVLQEFWLSQKDTLGEMFSALKQDFAVIVNGKKHRILVGSDHKVWDKIAEIYEQRPTTFRNMLYRLGLRTPKTHDDERLTEALRREAAKGLGIGELRKVLHSSREKIRALAQQHDIRIVRKGRGHHGNYKIRWTQEQDDTIREMRKAGRFWSEIAVKLGVSDKALTAHAKEIGIYTRTKATWTEEQKQLASHLYSTTDLTMFQICERLEVKYSTLKGWVKKMIEKGRLKPRAQKRKMRSDEKNLKKYERPGKRTRR